MERKTAARKIHVAIFVHRITQVVVYGRRKKSNAMEIYSQVRCDCRRTKFWSDIIFKGHKHIPTQLIEDAKNRTVAMYALSKTLTWQGSLEVIM